MVATGPLYRRVVHARRNICGAPHEAVKVANLGNCCRVLRLDDVLEGFTIHSRHKATICFTCRTRPHSQPLCRAVFVLRRVRPQRAEKFGLRPSGGERDACSRSVSKRSWDELHWKRHPGCRGQSSLVDAPNDTCREDCCGQGEISLTLQARLLSRVRRGDLRGVRIMQREQLTSICCSSSAICER
jgi:hypothetical protein